MRNRKKADLKFIHEAFGKGPHKGGETFIVDVPSTDPSGDTVEMAVTFWDEERKKAFLDRAMNR